MHDPISIQEYNRFECLLRETNWLSVEEKDHDKLQKKLFLLLEQLSQEERNLVYILLQDFININFNNFFSYAYDLSCKIDKLKIGFSNIFIIPVHDEISLHKKTYKSGDLITGIIRANGVLKSDKDTAIHFLTSVIGLENHVHRSKSLIVFCDDFIGSGSQFQNSLNVYEKYKHSDDVAVLATLSILASGYNKINDLGYEIIECIKLKKGISDNDKIPEKERAISIMLEIEKKFRVSKKFSLGYKQSEALLAIMQRVPNNTFPVFWWKYDDNIDPLFQRSNT